MAILVIVYTARGRGYNHTIHKVVEVGPRSITVTSGHVALHTVTSWSLI